MSEQDDKARRRLEDMVAGGYMNRSLADFWQACRVHLEEEQAKPNPDNALIALICDAVRIARELDSARTTGIREGMELAAKIVEDNMTGYLKDLIRQAKP